MGGDGNVVSLFLVAACGPGSPSRTLAPLTGTPLPPTSTPIPPAASAVPPATDRRGVRHCWLDPQWSRFRHPLVHDGQRGEC